MPGRLLIPYPSRTLECGLPLPWCSHQGAAQAGKVLADCVSRVRRERGGGEGGKEGEKEEEKEGEKEEEGGEEQAI